MRNFAVKTLMWVLTLFVSVSAIAQDQRLKPGEGIRSNLPGTVAITGATIVVQPGEVITEKVLIVREGKISALTTSDKIPAGAKVIDLTGKMIYPSFVEPFLEAAHNATTDPGLPYWNAQISPQRKMKDGLVLDEATLEKLRRAGIATAAVVPSDRIIKGTSCVVTTGTKALADRLLKAEWGQHVRLTLSARGDGYPSSPMGAVALARQAMLDAQWYHQAWQAYERDPSISQPEACDALDVLSQQMRDNQLFVFDGLNELFVLRADDFAREFGLTYMVRGSGREYLRLDAIAKVNRPILVPVNFPKAPNVATPDAALQAELGELMHWELAPENPGRLAKAGVTIALTSHGLREPTEFLVSIRKAIQRGLSADEALKAVTLTPAKLLGVEEHVGTLSSGKIANFIVVDKELWDENAKILETWVQGERFNWATESADSVDGTWRLDLQGGPGKPAALWLELTDSKKKVTGSLRKERELKSTSKPDTSAETKDTKPAEETAATEVKKDEVKKDEEPGATDEKKEDEKKEDAKEAKSQLIKLENLTFKDRQLVGRFPLKQLLEAGEGTGQLTLTTLTEGDGKRLVGRLLWSDGSVSTAVAVFDAELSAAKSADPEEKKETEAKRDGNQEGGEEGGEGRGRRKKVASTEVLSDVRYPLVAAGRMDAPVAAVKVIFKNATVWTCGTAGVLNQADVLVEEGVIRAVGVGLVAPEGALVIDATGMHLSPGIIDCHSHMATDSGVNESGQAITAEVRIGDFVDCNDITIYRQLAGGVTAANILHGSANPIGGQNQVIKLRWGALPNEMKMTEAPPGIKFALGENVKRSNSSMLQGPIRYPMSRMGVEQIVRDQFAAALEYEKNWNDWKQTGRGLPPRRDLQSDTILEIVRGQRWVHCHSYRQDEILAFLRVLEDYDVRVGSLQHILEGYKVAEVLAAHGAMASSFSDWWAYKFEVFDAIPHNGALMQQQGIVVSFNSDDDELARHLNHEAAKAVKYGGVRPEEALKFVTLNPAKQLRIDDYVGSIEVGKQADLVLWSSSPLSTMSRCEQTWIDGKKYFDRQLDIQNREATASLRAKLVQKVLDSGEETLAAGERTENPAGEWARHDEYCHAKGVRHQHNSTHQHR
jgi:imidazolonepropionase-like amidohydrolase